MFQDFANPPAQYRVMPFWFWNAKLDFDEIERQIVEMHHKGAGGFFIHGRFGLGTTYMGHQWMLAIERACDKAKELGMHVYLYDENPFPSGVAGGKAMETVEHYNKYLDISRLQVGPGEPAHMQIPEGELISAVAIDIDDRDHLIDLHDHVKRRHLEWTAPDSRFEVIVFVSAVARCSQFFYGSEPDYFNESLLDTFFQFTHDQYAKRLKPYMGDVIKGIFTDEPKIQCIYHMHEDASTTAWFADLPEQFKKDHGYDLIPKIACLATDAGPFTGKTRRDFWATVTDAYINRFFKRYRKWCDDNSIDMVGHLFLEEGLYANTMYQGDFTKVLAQFSVPGVDHLGLTTEGDYGLPNLPASTTRIHGQKLASSVAHLTGAQRTLSETFGCCGWNLSLEDMKWIYDWQASLGVNFLCPHAFYYSISGTRKTDAPPSQFYQTPYWQHYKLFADYAARLSYILSQGKHKTQVGLLYPIKGFQSEWAPGNLGRIDSLIAGYFDTYCSHLIKEHIDYDILTEDAIKRAMSIDQRLFIGDESYELLILPPTTAIGYDTALKISEFVDDGGRLIGTVLLPVEDADGSAHEEVRSIFSQVFGKDPLQLRESAKTADLSCKPSLSCSSAGALFFEAPEPTDLPHFLRGTVGQAIRPEVSVRLGGKECHDITYVHRSVDGAEVFFFANGAREAREVQISIRCVGAPHMLNLENGALTALPNCAQRGTRTILLHRFEKRGSLLVFFGEEPALAVPPPILEMGEHCVLPDEWGFAIEGLNSLSLPSWQLDMTPGEQETQYDYQTEFEVVQIPEKLFLVLDDAQVSALPASPQSTYTVFINDTQVPATGEWITDVSWPSFDIASLVRIGSNKVRIRIEHSGWSGEPQLIVAAPRLMGSFSLDSGGSRLEAPRKSIRTGSWTNQGYPFFSGTAVYKQTANIPEFMRNQRVVICVDDPADMIEFVINGASAGVRPWPPFELDITHLVKPGLNAIELKITNSLTNMLLSEPRHSGLLGGARIIIY